MLVLVFAANLLYAHNHSQANMPNAEKHADSIMQTQMAEHQQMEAVNAFPNYHPLIVHFPIVLLLMAAVFQLLSLFFYKKEFGWTTLILLALGVLSTWLASNAFHAHPGELKGKAAEIFEIHEQMAVYTFWLSLAALIGKLTSQFLLKGKWWMEAAVALLLVASGVTVAIAGHHGAMLVHMEGIGPMGKYLETNHSMVMNNEKPADSLTSKSENTTSGKKPEAQEEDHHVGEQGKGPHGGTIEEADPNHIEMVSNGGDLVFYLLDGDAKPLDMKNVSGRVKMKYAKKPELKIELMVMGAELTAMSANNGQSFTATCMLTKDGKSFTANFSSLKDLPAHK
jgi:uncharacterized membrane protein